jgi:hypothetical protein
MFNNVFFPKILPFMSPVFKGPLKMGLIGCPETSVANYQSTPRNISEERISHLHLGGSLKSRILSTLQHINDYQS